MVDAMPRGRLLWHADLGAYRPARDDPARVVEWLAYHSVGTLIVDSLYGLVPAKDDRALAWYARLTRELSAADIELLVLHHFAKGSQDGAMIDRVYGGMEVTASAGSVLALSGEAGADEVYAYHVKQPAKVCGPWTLTHDHERGVTSAERHPEPGEFLRLAGSASFVEVVESCMPGMDGRTADRRVTRALRKLVASGAAREDRDVFEWVGIPEVQSGVPAGDDWRSEARF